MLFKRTLSGIISVFACFGLLFALCQPSYAEAEGYYYDEVVDVPLPSDTINYGNAHYKIFNGYRSFSEIAEFCKSLGGKFCSIQQLPISKLENKGNHIYLVDNTGIQGGLQSSFIWASGHPIVEKDGTAGKYKHVYAKIVEGKIEGYSCTENSFLEEYGEDDIYFVCRWSECKCSKPSLVKGVKNATCYEDGYAHYFCKVCSYTYNETQLAFGHNFGEWQVIKGSVLIPPIEKVKTCKECGYSESVTDWGKAWVSVAVVVGIIVLVIGLIGYIKAIVKIK